MRTGYIIIVICIVAASLMSCTTQGRSPTQLATNIINRQHVTRTTHDIYPAKNPQTVSLYTYDKKPIAAYRVIGVASVSKYSIIGTARQNELIHSMLKNLAASIGGDGLIDMQDQNQTVQAKIIAYQKILI